MIMNKNILQKIGSKGNGKINLCLFSIILCLTACLSVQLFSAIPTQTYINSELTAIHSLMDNSPVDAEKKCRTLLKNISKKGLDSAEAEGLIYLGLINKQFAKYAESMSEFLEASEIFDSLSIQNRLGVTYVEIGKLICFKGPEFFKEGNNYYNLALTLFQKNGNKHGIALANTARAELYSDYISTQTYNPDSALSCANHALSIAKSINDSLLQAEIYSTYAIIFLEKKDIQSAQKNILKSMELAKKLKNNNLLLECYFTLGKINFFANNLALSLNFGYMSEELAIKLSNFDKLQNTYNLLSQNYEKKNDFEKALKYYRLCVEIKLNIYSNSKMSEINILEKRYNSEKKNKENKLLKQKNVIKDLELANRNKLMFSMVGASLLIIFILVMAYRRREFIRREIFTKKTLEYQLQSLRLQMNPHFIFNSINSILFLISKKDEENAKEYLMKFSKLMRKILENSDNQYILFSQEIETLKLYLDLESLRFTDKFKYEIDISENINIYVEEFPPMLIQPYVENAIVHGLLNKSEYGLIKITLTSDENSYYCIIEDNGIGREKALEIKNRSPYTHKSYGMSITKSRIELFNSVRTGTLSERIIDLFDENNSPSGTRVEIIIPKTFAQY